MHNLLMIETSFQGWSICARIDGVVTEFSSHESLARSDVALFDALEKLTVDHPHFWKCIENIGCTIGPGRFNAVRLGISVMGTIMALHPELSYWTASAYDVLKFYDPKDRQIDGYAIFAKKDHCYYLGVDQALETAGLKKYSELNGVIHSLRAVGYETEVMTDAIHARDLMKLFDHGHMRNLKHFSLIEPIYAAML